VSSPTLAKKNERPWEKGTQISSFTFSFRLLTRYQSFMAAKNSINSEYYAQDHVRALHHVGVHLYKPFFKDEVPLVPAGTLLWVEIKRPD